MKILIKLTILSIVILSIIVSSCTEEIDIDLNSSDPQIVVEGNVTTLGESVIKISKSVNFDESNNFPMVQNATVELYDDMGNSEILSELSPGFYTSSLIGIEGRSYSLIVQVDGLQFSSFSKIPDNVKFDSLIVTKASGTGGIGGSGFSSNYEVAVKYKDPANESNYYRFVEFVNGEITNSYVFDDRLNNGQNVTRTLLNFNRELDSGDVLQVEMQCIDKPVYEYFNSFSNLQGGPGGSSTPANPYTNIDGAVLGYFSAHTSEIKEKVIQ